VQIILIAVGTRTPAWVKQGFLEYSNRLPRHCSLDLVEVPAVSRKHGDIGKIRREEGKRLLDRIPKGCHVVALSEDGVMFRLKCWRTLCAGGWDRGAMLFFW
jgi:23S rRNA (pseudouridine1915-N3)-methyltransferase